MRILKSGADKFLIIPLQDELSCFNLLWILLFLHENFQPPAYY